MTEQLALQKILQEKFIAMKARNPSYSIRAFSRRAGVSAGTLSLILLGKRKASQKLASRIAARLSLDPQERSELLKSFPAARHAASTEESQYLQLTADQFRLLGEWHYFAILNLISTKGFRSDAAWIARRLGLTETVACEALARLKRLQMIEEKPGGGLRRRQPRYRTLDDVASLSLRRSHHQTLDLARESLDRDPLERRDFTWVTFPMDNKKMTKAKTLIRKFQDDLIDILDQDADHNEVYRLAIQLFPLTKGENS